MIVELNEKEFKILNRILKETDAGGDDAGFADAFKEGHPFTCSGNKIISMFRDEWGDNTAPMATFRDTENIIEIVMPRVLEYNDSGEREYPVISTDEVNDVMKHYWPKYAKNTVTVKQKPRLDVIEIDFTNEIDDNAEIPSKHIFVKHVVKQMYLVLRAYDFVRSGSKL